jgi:hypothetical protein
MNQCDTACRDRPDASRDLVRCADAAQHGSTVVRRVLVLAIKAPLDPPLESAQSSTYHGLHLKGPPSLPGVGCPTTRLGYEARAFLVSDRDIRFLVRLFEG